MVVEGMQAVPSLVHHISSWNAPLEGLNHLLTIDWQVFAQLQTDTNIFSNFGKSWDHFVKTGQLWALLIGIVIGYLFKSFTSF